MRSHLLLNLWLYLEQQWILCFIPDSCPSVTLPPGCSGWFLFIWFDGHQHTITSRQKHTIWRKTNCLFARVALAATSFIVWKTDTYLFYLPISFSVTLTFLPSMMFIFHHSRLANCHWISLSFLIAYAICLILSKPTAHTFWADDQMVDTFFWTVIFVLKTQIFFHSVTLTIKVRFSNFDLCFFPFYAC